MPEPVPFLPGKRVGLHVLTPNDAPTLVRWISDPEVRRFVKITLPMGEAEEREWVEKQTSRRATDLVFGLVTAEGKYIGNMGLHKINHLHGTATTGSLIGEKDHWGKGFGYEAKMLLLHYAFVDLNLRRIASRTYDFNGRSQRCLEKCGYVHEGTLKEELWREGRYADTNVFALFKEDWLPLWEEFRRKHLA
jgi:RimJ/RimL family protein N-acetyltransferase